MSIARMTTGTAAPAGPALVGAFVFGRRSMPAVAFSALLTTIPAAMATTHRFEDTALRSRPSLPLAEEPAMVKRIRVLQAYEAGWDGPGSIGPTIETVKQAILFARKLAALGEIAQPHVSLASDGEINFYWKTSGLILDLGFTGTGGYSYFGRTSEGIEFAEDDVDVAHPLPEGLITALHA